MLVLYSLLCIAGGIIGFVKAGSTVSLVTGSIAGLTLLFCALRSRRGDRWPAPIVLSISLLLFGWFTYRLCHHFQVMPHLLMVIFSVLAVLSSVRRLSATRD